MQIRRDDIEKVGLYRTVSAVDASKLLRRCRRADELRRLRQSGDTLDRAHRENDGGLAGDRFDFDVDAGPRGKLWQGQRFHRQPEVLAGARALGKTEFFFNAGRGFHSNDARGTTIKVDPQRWRDTGG